MNSSLLTKSGFIYKWQFQGGQIATTLQLTDIKILIEESENKSFQLAELHAIFLAAMGELKKDKSFYV